MVCYHWLSILAGSCQDLAGNDELGKNSSVNDNLPITADGSVGENTDPNACYLHEKNCGAHSLTKYPSTQHGLGKTKKNENGMRIFSSSIQRIQKFGKGWTRKSFWLFLVYFCRVRRWELRAPWSPRSSVWQKQSTSIFVLINQR